MSSILAKAAKYKRIGTVLIEGEAHLKDPLMPPPQILKPNPNPKEPSPDDITDFPAYKTIPIPESIPYREGKYRPPSIPFNSGRLLCMQVFSHTTPISNKARSTPGAPVGLV
jgi:hypothetical protein